ncbi:hypothetical protein H1R20_g2941, partial [Candolleomyces eurysporus]
MKSFMDRTVYTPPDATGGAPSGRKGVKIFDLGVLSGPHTVLLEPQQGQLIVDYLIYTPVANTKFDGRQLIYDDTNPSFNFSGPWTPAENFDLSALPFNDTYTSTGQIGSSFAIDFVGNSISVYGAFNPSPGVVSATFSVDGSAPSPVQLLNRTSSSDDWAMHQLFFQHNFTEVSETPHILNVTVVNASDSQPFFLDYVITTGNPHTKLSVRQFKKQGAALKSTGLKIGLIILGIAIALFLCKSGAVVSSKFAHNNGYNAVETLEPLTAREQLWATRALKAEALLSAQQTHHRELKSMSYTQEVKRTRELENLMQQHKEKHAYLEKLVDLHHVSLFSRP